MKTKMIVFDLDGTLLHSDKSLSDYSVDVIRRYREQGGIVVIASGRNLCGIEMYNDQIQAKHFVTMNGSMTCWNGQVIDQIAFNEQNILHLVQQLRKIKDGRITITYPTYVQTNDPNIKRGVVKYSDLSEFETTQIHQISIVTDDMDSLMKIDEDALDCKRFSYADERNRYVFIPKSIDKFNGIKKLCEKEQISLEDVVIFGDDYNDLGMIQNALHSVVPENGVEYVKAIATYICKSNDEDGPCHWIEENLLVKE